MVCRDKPQSQRIELCDYLGIDFVSDRIAIRDPETGDPVDISSASLTFIVRSASAKEMELTTAGGGVVVINGEGGVVEIHITDAAKTAATIAAGSYTWFLTLTASGTTQLVAGGTYELGIDITAS